jgi:starvation-inducible DNA-binding protein
MTERTLETALNRLLGNLFTFYLEAHGAHWNVEGPVFAMLHEFFGELASDTYGSIDNFAESLRQHQFLAPSAMPALVKAATIKDEGPTTNPITLLQRLYGKNQLLMKNLKEVSAEAANVDDQGLQNFTQERLGAHLKWDWQLRSHLTRVKA